MRKIHLIILISLLITSCKNDIAEIKGIDWFPLQNEFGDQPMSVLHFTDSGTLITRTLGTDVESIVPCKIVGNKISFENKENESIKIVKSSKNSLELLMTPEITINYIPFPNYGNKQFSDKIESLLLNDSWYLSTSTFDNERLIEFKESLEDRILLPPFRDKMKSADVHFILNNYSNYKTEGYWSVDYYNQTNILRIRESYDGFNDVILLTAISDSLIRGIQYHNNKIDSVQLIKRKSKVDISHSLSTSEWQLADYIEVPSNISASQSKELPNECYFTVTDLKTNSKSLTFNEDYTFLIRNKKDTVSAGSWRIIDSSNIVELTNNYKKCCEFVICKSYLSILDFDSSSLSIYNSEQILNNNQVETIYISETYKQKNN